MSIKDLQSKITQLKQETDTCILAHSYQNREIIEIADHTGDSYKIAVDAMQSTAENIILCGVRFMAETAKILNEKKRVFLPNPHAGCPMAEQFTPEDIMRLIADEPDRAVVAYVNTTADLKKLCDVCVTSSSAIKIVNALESEKILFIPDCNLGDYIKQNCPDKNIRLVEGGCPYHAAVTIEDVEQVRALYPNAELLVHPECSPEVLEKADFIGSTSAIMDYAETSDKSEFIIGTEMSIREHLQYDLPNKTFHALSQKISCPEMRMTTLTDVYTTLLSIKNKTGDNLREIVMTAQDVAESRKCIDEMLRLGGE
jgi:quinolinate synthase